MKKGFFLIAVVLFAGLALSACNEQDFLGPHGELHSDSPGFLPVTRDSGQPEPPSGDVSKDPEGTTGGTTGATTGEDTGDATAGGTTGGGTDEGTTGGTTGGTGETPGDGPHEADLPAGADAFADRMVSKTIGDGGGFNEDKLPDIVLGAPKGAGLFQGSFDVLSLGGGGEIVLEMTDYLVFDGADADFTVFENAFEVGSSGSTFAEPGIVGVSEDGVDFVDFPCDLSVNPYAGCAGVRPVLANPDINGLNPRDPSVSGGDSFDLSDVGLKTARFIRIRDSGLGLGPIGPGTRGFDLDAVAVIHGTLP